MDQYAVFDQALLMDMVFQILIWLFMFLLRILMTVVITRLLMHLLANLSQYMTGILCNDIACILVNHLSSQLCYNNNYYVYSTFTFN